MSFNKLSKAIDAYFCNFGEEEGKIFVARLPSIDLKVEQRSRVYKIWDLFSFSFLTIKEMQLIFIFFFIPVS